MLQKIRNTRFIAVIAGICMLYASCCVQGFSPPPPRMIAVCHWQHAGKRHLSLLDLYSKPKDAGSSDATDDDDDDDGWGTTATTSLKESDLQQLQALRQKPTTASVDESSSSERDLFIPIFTLVAIAGFTGAYGYEMFRLYSNGELYLPF